ncbi:MAG: PKD domain-containing protein [Bacteroidales bacterium]|nr:PKD domain-containing protein [Bacteroidales bacterium]
MNRIAKLLLIGFMLLTLPMRFFAQNQIKITEYNIHNIPTIEERVFIMHSIANSGYYCYQASEKPNTIDIFAANDNVLDTPEADFDFFLDNLYEDWAAFNNLDKIERGNLFVEWRYELGESIFLMLNEDFNRQLRDGNSTCDGALPFCTDNGLYQFPAGVNAGNLGSQVSPYYCSNFIRPDGSSSNCLYTTPNPAFYYMQIDQPGNLNIKIYSSPRYDIDFDCWGPFPDINTACSQLSCSNMVDCSYAGGSQDEFCHINNAQTGQYYILLLTNYGNSACNIMFENIGTGTTNCGIMPPLVDNDGPYCVGETIHLTANGQAGSTYSWTGPGGFSSNQQNPTRTNCTMAMAGTYTCTISVGSQTNSATTEVVIYPQPTANFNYTSVCKGTPTQFTSTSTTNPSGQQMTYRWNFGDGGTSSEQNPSHTYAQAGNYNVTLTTTTGGGACSSQKQQTVPVYAAPTASASALPNVVMYGGTSQLSASAGTAGTFNFHWEPANKVVNPNSQNTATIGLQATTTFTVTITNPQGGCSSSAQVTVSIEGSGMTAMASADAYELCEGESTTLHATPSGGTGDYTYTWTPANTLSNPNIQNPVATPPVGTTQYTCQVGDGYTTQNVSVSIMVHPNTESHPNISICPDDVYSFFGQDLNEPGSYNYTTTNQFGCDSTVYLTLEHYETYETPMVRSICNGDAYDFFGQQLTTAGQYQHTLESVHGCDSVIKLTLRVNPVYEYDIERSFCAGSYYPFNGQNITQPGDYTYNGQTVLGCDSIVHLHLSLTNYNSKVYDIERCNQPYTWPSTGEHFEEVGEYFRVDTIPGPTCDSIVTLNLSIHQDYPNVSFSITNCDNYTWENYGGRSYIEDGQTYFAGRTYDHSGNYIRRYQSIHGCDSIVTMHLTINGSIVNNLPAEEGCDQVEWPEAGISFVESSTQSHLFTTVLGCDSLVNRTVNMEYTPNPTTIEPTDASNTAGHWVITATEFQINSYKFSFSEGAHPATCHWDSIQWSCSAGWPFDILYNGRGVNLYVLQYTPDTVWLNARVFNKCAPEGVDRKYWLICSFYGIEEQSESLVNVDIVPNPNNGEMTLNFEYLTGNVNIKVYDMRGNLLDDFDTYNNIGPNSMRYNMKDYSDGMYFFVVSGKEGTVTKKVIINK